MTKISTEAHDSDRHVLLVDVNRGSYPLLRALTRLGWNVTVIGADSRAPLARLCSRHIEADYADVQQLSDCVAQSRYAAIIPGCTDASYLACSRLSVGIMRGIDSSPAVQQILDKQAFHVLAERLGIRQPRRLSISEALREPRVLVKPVDGFSGDGVTLLDGPTEQGLRGALEGACRRSSSGRFLIEEFVEGQLYSHSAFIRGQSIDRDFFVREDCGDYPFAVDTSCMALDLGDSAKQEVRSDVERLVKHLALVDGLIHTQFIESGGRPYLLEATRRHPGDLYGELVRLSTGFDYATQYLKGFMPDSFRASGQEAGGRFIIRHTVTAGAGQDLWGIRFHSPVKLRQWIPLASAGERLGPAPKGRAGIMFIESSNEWEHRGTYQKLLDRELYSLEG